MGAPELFSPTTTTGGAPVGGTGTSGTIPVWTGATPSTTLTDSLLSQSGAIVTNSGTFRAASGTPDEPGYTFSDASGTGMYRAASGTLLRFSVSDLYAFGVTTTGNFGIGTTAPASWISANSTVLAVAAGGNLGTVRVSNTSNFSGNHAEFYAGVSAVGIWGATNCPMLFYTNSVERMRVSASGVQAASQAAIGTSSFTAGASLTTVADLDVYGVRVGRGAGAAATNTAVGANTLNANTSGTGNTAIGASALNSVTTGTNNTMLGYVAGSGVSTGSSNTMIGFATASGGSATGNDNTLVGAIAGNQITSGNNNVCVGSNAGQTQTVASDVCYVGKNAGYFQTGNANTAVGRSAMTGSTGANGQANSALGNSALIAVTTGSYNVCAGFNAGNNITTGSSNIVLGTDAQTAAATDSNQLVLGSATRFVATNGGATTYYATAGASLGYVQIRLNGANVKIPVYAP